LFASILKKEGDDYFLVTPIEKARIQVEDVPFVVVEMELNFQKQQILFRTNLDEVLVLSEEHYLVLKPSELSEQELPYLHVRNGLFARFNRSVYYQAIEQAQEKQGRLYLSSAGESFCIGTIE
jgi:uncharacterized protein